MTDYLLISFVGAVLVMDTSVAFQVQISQPIIASTIIGWLMGDPLLGLKIGLLLQLLWIGHIPVGAHIVPAGNFASIISTAVAISFIVIRPELESFIILLAIICALTLSFAGAKVVKFNRNWNIIFFDRALESIKDGNLKKISLINLSALVLHFFIIFLLILAGVYLTEKMGMLFINQIPAEWNYYARFTEYGILGIGVGLMVPFYKGPGKLVIMLLGALAGVLIYLF